MVLVNGGCVLFFFFLFLLFFVTTNALETEQTYNPFKGERKQQVVHYYHYK
jgi:hypothetical protein